MMEAIVGHQFTKYHSPISTLQVIIIPMDIQELTRSMHAFVQDKGWYEAGSLRPQTLRNLAISLNLEAAEVLEHFQWAEDLRDPQELAGELADVALYLLQIASLAGIDLEQAILDKLDFNYKRQWDVGETTADGGSQTTEE
jgi:NTP pyrophosphatase (non-canonical NTP hydrolase)